MNFIHRKPRALLFVSLLLSLSLAVIASAQVLQRRAEDEKAKPQSKTEKAKDSQPSLVKLNVTVLDASNRPVNDIAQGDVQVFENDAPQTVISFAPQAGALSYGLLIDSSGSLRSQIETVIKAGQAIVANTRPEDEAFIMRFISKDNINVLQDWTSNRARLGRAFDDIYPEGGQSAIVDAIYKAERHMNERASQEAAPHRHALILITDGEERDSQYTVRQLLELARASDTQIFCIGLVNELEGIKTQEKAQNFLNTLAFETGGRAFFLNSASDLPQITSEILMELSAQYVVGYTPTNAKRDGSFRKLRVTIKDKAGRDKRTALTRPGYTAPNK